MVFNIVFSVFAAIEAFHYLFLCFNDVSHFFDALPGLGGYFLFSNLSANLRKYLDI